MSTTRHVATTDMQVTSIRFEQELKDKLKELAGHQGYQALIRDVLWDYVERQSNGAGRQLTRSDLRATIAATAQQEERCALTGKLIQPQEAIFLGLTTRGEMVPISRASL